MAYFLGYIISGVVFGAITKYVAESKGYEGGFWWGFFLGVIGLLVVGFRPDNHSQGANSPSNSSPAASQGAGGKKWTCIKCSTANPQKSKFCRECGEPRHYEWKCGGCGKVNAANVKFCFNCGKPKEAEEEMQPEIDFFEEEVPYTVIDDELIQCNKCGTKQAKIYKKCFRCGQSFETVEEEL